MFDLTSGTVLAAATILLLRRFGRRREPLLWSLALMIAALIYVGFAVAGDAGTQWIATESGGLLLYGVLALLGLRISPWFLVAGWLAHMVWDVGLHSGDAAPFVPDGYPVACIAYDVIVALYIATRCGAWTSLPDAASIRSGS